jgi:hypothetical protein
VREVNHSPPSSAEVENEWSYTSNFRVCFLGLDRDNVYFLLLAISVAAAALVVVAVVVFCMGVKLGLSP